jgi:hypothetical protein
MALVFCQNCSNHHTDSCGISHNFPQEKQRKTDEILNPKSMEKDLLRGKEKSDHEGVEIDSTSLKFDLILSKNY